MSSVNLPFNTDWRKEVERMSLLAGLLLALMLVFFVITSLLQPAYPWLAYPRAFSEAAIVGACADWFAVVALFRHPFGIPIPHTAVVPRHKNRIGENLGRFISNNFLAPTELTARMERVNATGWIAHWIKQPNNAKTLANRLQGLFPPLLELLSEEQLHQFSRGVIRKGIDSIAAAPISARLLSFLIAHGYHEEIFDLGLDKALTFFRKHKQNIQHRVSKNSEGWFPGWVDTKITDAFFAELLSNMKAARGNIDHPWRHEYRAQLNRLVVKLANDQVLFERFELIKSEVFDNSVVDGYLDWLGLEVEQKLQSELHAEDGLLSGGLVHALVALGNWLDQDPATGATINRWAQQLVLSTIVPNREEISTFVAEVVARWDTATLVDKLELQFGKDLQYIRINGTLVGGLVGLLIYTASHLLGTV